jgi:hypothetical protein
MAMQDQVLTMLSPEFLQSLNAYKSLVCASNTSQDLRTPKPCPLPSHPPPVAAHSFSFFTTTTLVLFLSPFAYVPTIPGRNAEGPTMDLLDLY